MVKISFLDSTVAGKINHIKIFLLHSLKEKQSNKRDKCARPKCAGLLKRVISLSPALPKVRPPLLSHTPRPPPAENHQCNPFSKSLGVSEGLTQAAQGSPGVRGGFPHCKLPPSSGAPRRREWGVGGWRRMETDKGLLSEQQFPQRRYELGQNK